MHRHHAIRVAATGEWMPRRAGDANAITKPARAHQRKPLTNSRHASAAGQQQKASSNSSSRAKSAFDKCANFCAGQQEERTDGQ